ncbi:IPT/TIG domain-containing protein [Streptomyces sp. NBC_00872]|uniref:IPT/TIG domain-containing protein n=1 Tax=Streptomyces sp. NBC_00872 TaxID=2903686 RepID=UPI002F90FD47|nr:IPT/TIG domain-containing protein [Streptomyces sp. NBC_00872]
MAISVSPDHGSTAGGTAVTVTGPGLAGTFAVRFGTESATDIVQVSPTQVTAKSPAGSGVVGVTVTTPGGTSAPVPFYYVGPPVLTHLSSTSGPLAGGNTVNGTALSTATGVTFGPSAATPTVLSDSQLTVIVPPGNAAGPVVVRVTTAGARATA